MKYQKTFKAFVFVCLCCMATILFAQKPQGDATILVKVTIVDVDKNPLPGATVKVTGKAQGVVANDQGEVSLWVDRNTQIEFKYAYPVKPSRKNRRALDDKFRSPKPDTSEVIAFTGL